MKIALMGFILPFSIALALANDKMNLFGISFCGYIILAAIIGITCLEFNEK